MKNDIYYTHLKQIKTIILSYYTANISHVESLNLLYMNVISGQFCALFVRLCVLFMYQQVIPESLKVNG